MVGKMKKIKAHEWLLLTSSRPFSHHEFVKKKSTPSPSLTIQHLFKKKI
jgi:hypothetical protein